MILLSWIATLPPRRRVAAVFGSGLIGGSIVRSLVSRHAPHASVLPFSWEASQDVRRGELAKISSAILAACTEISDSQFDIIWSAGRAGFGGDRETFERERRSFDEVLSLCVRLASWGFAYRPRFHLLSSAGGLFEGQRHVGPQSTPSPLRPYGHSKLSQEQAIQALEPSVAHTIYRPSSVYGYGGTNGRVGLIVALINAALRNETASLFGLQETMRDFVLASDIGRFISNNVANAADDSRIWLLATGRPTSMFEVVSLVESIMGRRLSLRFVRGSDNALHNSYLPAAVAADWSPTSLEVGIANTAEDMRSQYFQRSTCTATL